MRILHLTTSFPASSDDVAGPFVLRLMESLEEGGCNCQVLTPSVVFPTYWPNPGKVHRFRYAPWKMQVLAQKSGGIPVALKKNFLAYCLIPPFLLNMAIQLIREARGCDLIHAHWSICGAIAVMSKKFHQKPIVVTLHGSDHHKSQENIFYSWLHNKAVEGASFTVGVSKTIVSQQKEQEKIRNGKRFCFIPNGVSKIFYDVRPDSYLSQQPLRFLIVGSLIPRKGVDIAIESLANVGGDNSWQLTIIGDGPELENLKSLALDRDILDQIDFHGSIPPDSIPDIMGKHHVLLLPSHKEGRPSVVLEAMAAGMAVVASDIDGTRELVRNGITGWLFPSGDENALTQILLAIQKNEKDVFLAGVAGRQWMIDQKLTWEETASQYKKLYKKVVTSSS